jgi:hypothetical protein
MSHSLLARQTRYGPSTFPLSAGSWHKHETVLVASSFLFAQKLILLHLALTALSKAPELHQLSPVHFWSGPQLHFSDALAATFFWVPSLIAQSAMTGAAVVDVLSSVLAPGEVLDHTFTFCEFAGVGLASTTATSVSLRIWNSIVVTVVELVHVVPALNT